jgi:hypothetical protein
MSFRPLKLLFVAISTTSLFAVGLAQGVYAGQYDTAQALESLERNGPRVTYSYPKDQKQRLSGKELGLCMALAAQSEHSNQLKSDLNDAKCSPFNEGKRAKHGLDYWNEMLHSDGPLLTFVEALQESPFPSYGLQNTDDFLDYLGGDFGRSCDYVSGHEKALKQWILRQPDHSIDPLKIFRKSLNLSRGNLMTALLTIHQVLRNEARWWDPDRYVEGGMQQDLEEAVRKELRFFNKFVDIRGDLRERGQPYHGDHPGTWYRIWGAMLYRLGFVQPNDFRKHVASSPSCVARPFNPFEKLLADINDLRAAMVFAGDEFAKRQGLGGNHEFDLRKVEYDEDGGSAASWMYQGIRNPKFFEKNGITPSFCTENGYLHTDSPDR